MGYYNKVSGIGGSVLGNLLGSLITGADIISVANGSPMNNLNEGGCDR